MPISQGKVVFTPGRWHNQGIPVVYCGDHPGSALLEILVHVDLSDIPTSFQLLEIHCPDDVMVAAPHVNQSQLEDLAWTRETGSRLLEANTHCVIKVPSAILPIANNFLIHPRHPDSKRLRVQSIIQYPFDSRLLR
jgi:RES domain-containing protein